MEYKILAIGDPHLKVNNIATLRLLRDKIVAVIRQHRPNGVVILGDLHDTHEKMNVYAWMEEIDFLNVIRLEASEAGAEFVKYILGNHDIPSNNLYLEDIHPFKNLERSGMIVSKPEAFFAPIGRFGFIPYVPNGRFMEAVNLIEGIQFPVSWVALFCHQEFKNADLGGFISKNGDEWPKDGPQVISGHVHKRGRPQENILYIGSPYQTNFGETETKYVSLFTYGPGLSLEETLIDLGMPKKLTMYVSIAELNEHDYKLSSTDENRLIIQDSSVAIGNFKKSDKYKELQQLAKVIFKPTDKTFIKRDVAKKTFLEILREYVAKEDASVAEVFEEVMNAPIT